MFASFTRPKIEDFIKPKNKNTKKLKKIIKNYEKEENLSEYAKGRLSAFKMCLEMLK